MGGRPPPGVPRFNVSNFAAQELRLGWTTYSILSGFAHSNIDEPMLGIFEAIDEPEPRRFGLQMSYDDRLISAAAPTLQFILLLHLRFATDVLCDSVSLVDQDQFELATEAVAVLTTALRTHPRPHWPSVTDDIDYVFNLIALADNQLEWQHLPKKRPTVATRG